MDNHTRKRHSATNDASVSPVPQQQLQHQQQRQGRSSKRFARPKSLIPYRPCTSTDSLSDGSPTNDSATVSQVPSFSDLHDFANNFPLRRCAHLNGSTSSSNTNTSLQRVPARVPCRHGSLENLSVLDAVGRFMPEGSTTVNPLNTAPPPRLSRRATVSEGIFLSTVGLVASSSQTPASRYPASPPQTALSQARLRQVEADCNIDRSNSPRQDQLPSVNASLRRLSNTAPVTFLASLPLEERRHSSVASGEPSVSNPLTLLVSTSGSVGHNNNNSLILTVAGSSSSGSARPPASSGADGVPAANASSASRVSLFSPEALAADCLHPADMASSTSIATREEGSVTQRRGSVSPGVAASAGAEGNANSNNGANTTLFPPPITRRAGASVSPLSSYLARRHRCGSNREASTSPSADSGTAADDIDTAAAQARNHHRTPSLAQVTAETGSKSPSAGPKRVHFNLQDPSSESSSFLASSVRVSGGSSGDDNRGIHSLPPRAGQPVFLGTSSVMRELAGATTPENGNTRLGLSGSGGNNGSITNSTNGGITRAKLNDSTLFSAAAASTGSTSSSTLSLWVNLKDGRIEAHPTTNTVASSGTNSRSFSLNPFSLNDTIGGATYTPEMPLPKPALKPYSRYNGDAAGSSSDSTPMKDNRKTTFMKGTYAVVARSMLATLQRAITRRPRRPGAVSKANEAVVLQPSVSQQHSITPEVIVKWSLLGLAALLSFVLILLATFID